MAITGRCCLHEWVVSPYTRSRLTFQALKLVALPRAAPRSPDITCTTLSVMDMWRQLLILDALRLDI